MPLTLRTTMFYKKAEKVMKLVKVSYLTLACSELAKMPMVQTCK